MAMPHYMENQLPTQNTTFESGFSWTERCQFGTSWFIDSTPAPADVLSVRNLLNPLIIYLYTVNLNVAPKFASLHLMALIYVGMETMSLLPGRLGLVIAPLFPYLCSLHGVFGLQGIR